MNEQLEAGRELDALVAEYVMGWERSGDMVAPPVGDKRRTWAAEWDDFGCPDWMPHYSTNIAAAWEVVEKIHQPFQLTRVDGNKWRADFGGFTLRYYNSVPLVICYAALKSVGYESLTVDPAISRSKRS